MPDNPNTNTPDDGTSTASMTEEIVRDDIEAKAGFP